MTIQDDMKNGVLIYGTAAGGEAILQMCKEKNIKVLGFCDDKSVQIGQDFEGVPIVRFLDYVKKYPDVPVFVGIRGIDVIVYKLKKLGIKKWYLCNELLDDVDYHKYTYGSGNAYGVMEVENTIDCHRKFLDKDYFFINNLDLIITTKCSLRCRDCCNLMQYYEDPVNYPVEDILYNLRKLLTYVSEINEIRIIGGEPFMHPQIADILDGVASEDKIKKISVLSNGTIMPSPKQWKSLENKKIILVYTNYGENISKNLKKIMEIVEEKSINCYYRDTEDWTDCCKIADYGRSHENLVEVLEACCAKHLYTMLENKVYRCPFMANVQNLKAIDIENDEYFNVDDYLSDIRAGQKEIERIFYEKDYFKACNYCPGRPYETKLIPPAVQSKEVLKYPDLRGKK